VKKRGKNKKRDKKIGLHDKFYEPAAEDGGGNFSV
jgi:hypothetical protein